MSFYVNDNTSPEKRRLEKPGTEFQLCDSLFETHTKKRLKKLFFRVLCARQKNIFFKV